MAGIPFNTFIAGLPSASSINNSDMLYVEQGGVSKQAAGVLFTQADLPTGGTAGQVLAKNSSTNFDVSWLNGAASTVSAFSTTGGLTSSAISTVGLNGKPDNPFDGTTDLYNIGLNFSETQNTVFDFNYHYTGAAPATTTQDGAYFFTNWDPNTSVDNHKGIAAGITATLFSSNTGVLKQIAGGVFNCFRTGSGSTNPAYGLISLCQIGTDFSTTFTTCDYPVGGRLASIAAAWSGQMNWQSGQQINLFAPVVSAAQLGSWSEALVSNQGTTNLMSAPAVGVAGQVNAMTTCGIAIGGYFTVNNQAGNISSTVGNAYGVYIEDIPGAAIASYALRTGTGVVQHADHVVMNKDVVGNITVNKMGTTTISSVGAVIDPTFLTASNSGSKTYTYVIVPVFASGVTGPGSAAASTTHGADDLTVSGNANLITFSAVVGAVGGYNVYRTVAGGATTTSTGKIANIAQTFQQATAVGGTWKYTVIPQICWLDKGLVGDSTSPPTADQTGNLSAAAYVQTGTVAVSALPAAAAGNTGARYMVNNATQSLTAGIGTIVAGSGGNTVPVVSDGSNWRIG